MCGLGNDGPSVRIYGTTFKIGPFYRGLSRCSGIYRQNLVYSLCSLLYGLP